MRRAAMMAAMGLVWLFSSSALAQSESESESESGAGTGTGTGAGADTTGPRADDVVFKLFSENGPDAQVQLVNAVAANKKDWPTVLNAGLSSPGVLPPISCTGVLIGPGVFLTAAHCFDKGADRGLRDGVWLNAGTQNLRASCRISTEYAAAMAAGVWNFTRPRVSADFALCAIDLPVVQPQLLSGLQNDNVDTVSVLSAGDPVLMTGYGCTSLDLVSNPDALKPKDLDGLFRIGDVTVSEMPVAGAADEANFLVIRSPPRSAAVLCSGDSGGPLISGASTKDQAAKRRVRGVNSNVDRRVLGASRITPLATATFIDFAKTWLADHPGRTICGLNGEPGFIPCRD